MQQIPINNISECRNHKTAYVVINHTKNAFTQATNMYVINHKTQSSTNKSKTIKLTYTCIIHKKVKNIHTQIINKVITNKNANKHAKGKHTKTECQINK